MSKHIKLLWDIRSANALPMAKHHAKHLEEYAAMKNLQHFGCGVQEINTLHCAAYLIVAEKDMIQVRDDLKPHRGELSS